MNIEESSKRIKRTLRRLNMVAGKTHPHTCSNEFCGPINEEQLIYGGVLTAPVVSQYVYVCKYLQVHVCLEKTCTNVRFGVCNISGICHGQIGGYSSYDSNNERTFNPRLRDWEMACERSGPKHQTITRKPKHNQVNKRKQRAAVVINKLLYSSTREKTNERKKQCRAALCLQKQKEMIAHNGPVNIISLLSISDSVNFNVKELSKLKYSEDVVQLYSANAAKLFAAAKETKITCNPEFLTIGMLYTMCEDFIAADNTKPIKFDHYLFEHLPDINDVRDFFSGATKTVVVQNKRRVKNICNTYSKQIGVFKLNG